MISVRIFNNECNDGIVHVINIKRETKSARKLHFNFSFLRLITGQSPSNCKLKRFSFTAHSKSTYCKRKFNKLLKTTSSKQTINLMTLYRYIYIRQECNLIYSKLEEMDTNRIKIFSKLSKKKNDLKTVKSMHPNKITFTKQEKFERRVCSPCCYHHDFLITNNHKSRK